MIATRTGTIWSALGASALVVLVTGCKSKPCPTTPQTTAQATETASPVAGASVGPGQIDPEIASIAHQAQGVYKIKLKLEPSGRVVKVAVYHRDASKVADGLAKAVEEKFPGAKIVAYESEHYLDAGPVHEVEFTTADGRECELSRTASGTDRYVECKITADALPAAVAAAVSAAAPGGQIEEAETKDLADGSKRFHIEVRVGEILHYLVLAPDGKLIGHYLRIPAAVDLEVSVDK